MLTSALSSSKTPVSKQQAIVDIKSLIRSRMRFNWSMANFIDRIEELDEAIFFIAHHFYNPDSTMQQFLLGLTSRQQKQAAVKTCVQSYRGDGNNFERMLYCFNYAHPDQVLNELVFCCQILLRFSVNTQEEAVNDNEYIRQIQRQAIVLLDSSLLKFSSTYRAIDAQSATTYELTMKIPLLMPLAVKARALASNAKNSISRAELVKYEEHYKSIKRILEQRKPLQQADLGELIFSFYQLDLFIKTYQHFAASEFIEPAAQKENNNHSNDVKKPAVFAQKAEVEPIATVIAELDKLSLLAAPDDPPTSRLEDDDEISKEVTFQYDWKKKFTKKVTSTQKQEPIETARERRNQYYAELLKRHQETLMLIFRENTPHMEIKWSAVEAIFNAIRAKFDGKGGSKMNLTFTDVFGHQYTETVLKPIDFTERRIHITHRPNQTCDKIASLYVTILRQCFERFGINPERLWPSAENDTLTIKAKAKF